MRRHNFEMLYGHYTGLILDCLYYCWQNEEITDDEYVECYRSLNLVKLLGL